jgi:hypothetical protein
MQKGKGKRKKEQGKAGKNWDTQHPLNAVIGW